MLQHNNTVLYYYKYRTPPYCNILLLHVSNVIFDSRGYMCNMYKYILCNEMCVWRAKYRDNSFRLNSVCSRCAVVGTRVSQTISFVSIVKSEIFISIWTVLYALYRDVFMYTMDIGQIAAATECCMCSVLHIVLMEFPWMYIINNEPAWNSLWGFQRFTSHTSEKMAFSSISGIQPSSWAAANLAFAYSMYACLLCINI